MTEPEKLAMRTPSLADVNYAVLAAMFPGAVTETKDENGSVVRAVDKDALEREINARVVEGRDERYQFTWPDKRKSVMLANSPVEAALRPCREESLDFDSTGNLYIEGDNLDVLKLLRETYLSRVKMIYIDPPYNTSNDFIYNDDFTEDAGSFLGRDGQYDGQGNRLVQNPDSSGRFHTDWLNMIYPRLRIAKDLLRDDGAVFISCDDNEVNNLRKVCDDIFGPGNFIAQVIVQTNPRGRTFDRFIAKTHEYIIVYSKNTGFAALREIPKDEKAVAGYQKEDGNGKYRLLELRNRNPVFSRSNRPLLFYPFYADPKKLDVSMTPTSRHTVEIYPRNSEGADGCWTWGVEKSTNEIHLLCANLANTGKWSVFRKDYLEGTSLFTKPKGLWLEKEMNHENGKETVRELFGMTPFDFPKSVDYIKKCLLLGTSSYGDDIVLDFFSGSATTAHAVMQLNTEDGGKRRFILVQLPEVCAKGTEAAKAGYATICDIGKERIRRAGARIKAENPAAAGLDAGFRVLKLDSSNMKPVYYTPEECTGPGFMFGGLADSVKPGRTPEDLLFQVMLELGIPLSAKITMEGEVFHVNGNQLIACFSAAGADLITRIAREKPRYAVLRDSSFASDSAMVNTGQVFAAHSPATAVRVL